jgi:hypothetical protein
MSAARRNFIAITSVLAMVVFAALTIREFIAAGELLASVAIGILVPAAALWELARARSKEPDVADATVRMLPIVALALAGVAVFSR